MLRLLLLRHAKSAWNDASQTDFERPLNERGLKAAPKMGKYIANRKTEPELVLISSATRARQTTELALAQFKSKPHIQILDELYNFSGFQSMLNIIRNKGEKHSPLMVIAHNPTIEELAYELTGTGNNAARALMNQKYPSAGLAILDFDIKQWADLQTGVGTLISFTHPKDLPD